MGTFLNFRQFGEFMMHFYMIRTSQYHFWSIHININNIPALIVHYLQEISISPYTQFLNIIFMLQFIQSLTFCDVMTIMCRSRAVVFFATCRIGLGLYMAGPLVCFIIIRDVVYVYILAPKSVTYVLGQSIG